MIRIAGRFRERGRSLAPTSGGDEAHVQLRMAEAQLSALVDAQRTEKRMGRPLLFSLQPLRRAAQMLERGRRVDLVRHQYGRGPGVQVEAGREPFDEQSLLEKVRADSPNRQRSLK